MIKFKDVKKTFFAGNKKWTFGHVSFQLKKGESLAIIGRSGSGKSTLLHLAAAFLKPDEGQIHINGDIIRNLSEKKLREFRNLRTGFVFQDFYLFPEFNLIENVSIPLLIAGIDKKKIKLKTEEALERVGLIDKKFNLPRELSGGQKQRGAIARAIVCEPEVLYADEPTGNLDPLTGDTIIKLIKNIQKDTNTTFLLATHDEKLTNMCDKILRIDNGILV